MTELLDAHWEGYDIYVQPGGCVEVSSSSNTDESIHVCDWGGLVKAVSDEDDASRIFYSDNDRVALERLADLIEENR